MAGLAGAITEEAPAETPNRKAPMSRDEPPEIPPISYPAIRAELHFLGTLCEVLPEPSSISPRL